MDLKAAHLVAELNYVQSDAKHLVAQGSFQGAPAAIRLTRVDERSFLLTNRAFHWVSEYPFNW